MDAQWETAEEINEQTADRLRLLRKRKRISQEKLSSLSGVSLGSIKRFESTGQISFLSLTRIAMALDCGEQIKLIFDKVEYKNIQEVINENR